MPKPIYINIPHRPNNTWHKIVIALVLTFLLTQKSQLLAQSLNSTPTTGEIKGHVLDHQKIPSPSAVIQVYQNNVLKGGCVTDYDGNCTVKLLEQGYYDVLVLYPGFDSLIDKPVIVVSNQITARNYTLQRKKPTLINSDFHYPGNSARLVDRPAPIPPQFGEIKGQVFDYSKNVIINAAIQISQNNILKGECVTDFDGNFSFKLEEGKYDILVVEPYFDSLIEKSVSVFPNQRMTHVYFLNRRIRDARILPTYFGGYRSPYSQFHH